MGHALEVGNDDAQDAAGLQHTQAFLHESRRLFARDVLEYLRVVDDVETVGAVRKSVQQVVRLHLGTVRSHVDVGPRRVEFRTATDVQVIDSVHALFPPIITAEAVYSGTRSPAVRRP